MGEDRGENADVVSCSVSVSVSGDEFPLQSQFSEPHVGDLHLVKRLDLCDTTMDWVRVYRCELELEKSYPQTNEPRASNRQRECKRHEASEKSRPKPLIPFIVARIHTPDALLFSVPQKWSGNRAETRFDGWRYWYLTSKQTDRAT